MSEHNFSGHTRTWETAQMCYHRTALCPAYPHGMSVLSLGVMGAFDSLKNRKKTLPVKPCPDQKQ